MVRDVASALAYLHSSRIVHRDLKPENLLVVYGKDGGGGGGVAAAAPSLKLADFGLAMVVDEPLVTVCGTPTYVAPEILTETGMNCRLMWTTAFDSPLLFSWRSWFVC